MIAAGNIAANWRLPISKCQLIKSIVISEEEARTLYEKRIAQGARSIVVGADCRMDGGMRVENIGTSILKE
jgi:hypothetical protein